ncbi:MAG: hypothetical protein M3Q66_08350 [Chloroflexota bacterium]|nr:hypothetical protein [Chloroflexota bacterium]
MKKFNRLPREQATGAPDDVIDRNTDDGLNHDGNDVEAHRTRSGEDFAPRLPGTGGDFRRPSGGGEVDGDDVEGHRAQSGDGFAPRLPGTGGDFRRPSGGGEIDGDDAEGHAR